MDRASRDAAADVPAPERRVPSRDAAGPYECYCGQGHGCHLFLEMTPAERERCSRDKRQTAQWLWVNGLRL